MATVPIATWLQHGTLHLVATLSQHLIALLASVQTLTKPRGAISSKLAKLKL